MGLICQASFSPALASLTPHSDFPILSLPKKDMFVGYLNLEKESEMLETELKELALEEGVDISHV